MAWLKPQSMGAGPWQIVTKFFLCLRLNPLSRILNAAIATTTIFRIFCNVWRCRGGGLGTISINYGFLSLSKWCYVSHCTALLVVIVQVFSGNWLAYCHTGGTNVPVDIVLLTKSGLIGFFIVGGESMKKLISICWLLYCFVVFCPDAVPLYPQRQTHKIMTKNSVKSSQEEPITIRIGASITPHSEILKRLMNCCGIRGYQLDIVEIWRLYPAEFECGKRRTGRKFFQHRPLFRKISMRKTIPIWFQLQLFIMNRLGCIPEKLHHWKIWKIMRKLLFPMMEPMKREHCFCWNPSDWLHWKMVWEPLRRFWTLQKNPKNLQITEMAAAPAGSFFTRCGYGGNQRKLCAAGRADLNDALATGEKNSKLQILTRMCWL